MTRSVRKSSSQRLTESTDLVAAYENAGLGSDYRVRFIKDMIVRLEKERGLSKKQRDWLDALIVGGVPEVEYDKALYRRLEESAAVVGLSSYKKGVLEDFASQVRRGKALSPKQLGWAEHMMIEAVEIARHGPWNPTQEDKERLSLCVKLAMGRSSVYWHTHAGEANALEEVRNWLAGEIPTIQKWSVEKILKTFRSKLRELLEKPRFVEGDIGWIRVATSGIHMALITGSPYIDDRGRIVYPTLANGEFLEARTERLSKRRIKR